MAVFQPQRSAGVQFQLDEIANRKAEERNRASALESLVQNRQLQGDVEGATALQSGGTAAFGALQQSRNQEAERQGAIDAKKADQDGTFAKRGEAYTTALGEVLQNIERERNVPVKEGETNEALTKAEARVSELIRMGGRAFGRDNMQRAFTIAQAKASAQESVAGEEKEKLLGTERRARGRQFNDEAVKAGGALHSNNFFGDPIDKDRLEKVEDEARAGGYYGRMLKESDLQTAQRMEKIFAPHGEIAASQRIAQVRAAFPFLTPLQAVGWANNDGIVDPVTHRYMQAGAAGGGPKLRENRENQLKTHDSFQQVVLAQRMMSQAVKDGKTKVPGIVTGSDPYQNFLRRLGEQDFYVAAVDNATKAFVNRYLKSEQGSRPSDFDLRYYLLMLPMITEIGTPGAGARMAVMADMLKSGLEGSSTLEGARRLEAERIDISPRDFGMLERAKAWAEGNLSDKEFYTELYYFQLDRRGAFLLNGKTYDEVIEESKARAEGFEEGSAMDSLQKRGHIQ